MNAQHRELIELAALAVGLKADKSRRNGAPADNDGFDLAGNMVLDWHNGRTWNPRHFDDDTFRLQVTLRLTMNPDASQTEQATVYRADIGWITEKHEDHPDAFAAARMATLRAAAEIGKRLCKKPTTTTA